MAIRHITTTHIRKQNFSAPRRPSVCFLPITSFPPSDLEVATCLCFFIVSSSSKHPGSLVVHLKSVMLSLSIFRFLLDPFLSLASDRWRNPSPWLGTFPAAGMWLGTCSLRSRGWVSFHLATGAGRGSWGLGSQTPPPWQDTRWWCDLEQEAERLVDSLLVCKQPLMLHTYIHSFIGSCKMVLF